MALTCGNCGHRNRTETRFCTKCGTEIEKPATPQTPTCTDCGAEIPEGKRFCTKCGAGRILEAGPLPIQTLVCGSCGKELAADAQFCSSCGAPRSDARTAVKPPPPATPKPAPRPQKKEPPVRPKPSPPPKATVAPQAAAPAVPTAPGAHRHSPVVALVSGFLVPGAGQAYNGFPFRAFFLLIFSPLLVPWIYGVVDAHLSAKKIVAAGGRVGPGGWPWIGLQMWLAVDFVLFLLIVLTMRGTLS